MDPKQTWNSLESWLNLWFHEPDTEAVKICLCGLATHFYEQEKPLWLLLVGASGSGKTELAIGGMEALPTVQVLSDVTPRSFLSAREKGGRENSLLHRGGDSQLWLFKDFTTLLAMKFEDRARVAAALREIWDGSYRSDTGMGSQSWKGKVTVISAATPEFERHWALMRGLGERFLTVRWRSSSDSEKIADKIRAQAGRLDDIRTRTQQYVGELFAYRRVSGKLSDLSVWRESLRRLDAMASIVALLRSNLERDSDPHRSVLYVGEPESPTRISIALSQLIRTHMDIFHRSAPDDVEFSLARRLALDTIPPARRRIIDLIPVQGALSWNQLFHGTGLPWRSLERTLEDLVCLGVLKDETNGERTTKQTDRNYRFTDRFRRDCTQAHMFEREKAPVIVMPRRGRRPSSNPDMAVYSEGD